MSLWLFGNVFLYFLREQRWQCDVKNDRHQKIFFHRARFDVLLLRLIYVTNVPLVKTRDENLK